MRPGADDDLPPLRNVVIPDDARELEPDRQAWLREQGSELADLRGRGWRRLLPGPTGRRWAGRVGLLVPVMAVAAALSLLLSLTSGPGEARTPAAPLASPAVADGAVGGLLPDVLLASRVGPVSTRMLRPAVLMLLPATCDCQSTVSAVSAAAATHRLRVWLLSDSADLAASRQLASAASAAVGVDPGDIAVLSGAIAPFQRDYQMSGVTLVLVRADGVVTEVLRNVSGQTSIGPALAKLTAGTG